jgi:phage-related protein (TIGR01555 family)
MMTWRDKFSRWLTGVDHQAIIVDQTSKLDAAIAKLDAANAEIERLEQRAWGYAASWEADVHGTPLPLTAADIFKRPEPMPGVLPAGIAMDSANFPPVGAMTQWAGGAIYHEGLAFMGYPLLAELAQRVEYRHIASIWAEHATRKWIELKGPDEDKLKQLDQFLTDLNLKAIIRECVEYDCLMGRCQIFLDCDDYDRPEELKTPLKVDPRKVNKKRPLKRLKVVEPMWSYPGPYDSTNPLAPTFYRPQEWYVMGNTIHESRLLTIVGTEMPDMLKPAYAFGGMSMTQSCKPYVDNWLRARQSGSDLLNAFSTMVFKTEMDDLLTGGSAATVNQRMNIFNRHRSNRGTFVVGQNEELTNVAVPLSGVPDMTSQSQEQMASSARIPLSILLQVTPTGLNASSEGETRSFYADVNAYDEKVLRSPVQRVIELAQLSLWDEIDPEITFIFPPLWEMTAKESAEINKLEAETDKAYTDAGIVSAEEARERISQDETNLYHGVDLSGPAPDLDAENDNDNTDNVEAAE